MAVAHHATAAPKAFPDAEGYGATARGGRGGAVYQVTHLGDRGSGSLRACVQAEEPRTCVFRVGGTIVLSKQLSLGGPRLTIAGQTAPGDGVLLRAADDMKPGALLRINRDDVIVRHLRFRRGMSSSEEADRNDSLQLLNARRVILDHVSVSWGVDENVGIANSSDVTIQWSIIAEALRGSNHPKGAHSMGLLVQGMGQGVSIHHNLFAHNDERNPRIKIAGATDVVNNLVYNSGSVPTVVTDEPGRVNINYVGNTYWKGVDSPASDDTLDLRPTAGHGIEVYAAGNEAPVPSATLSGEGQVWAADEPFPTPSIITQPATEAAQLVLERAGAFPRDAVDRRLVDEVTSGSGSIIDDPSEVGGWPTLADGGPYPDADQDGMDDDWERRRDLDPANPDDRNLDRDGDGYTELEDFLNELADRAG